MRTQGRAGREKYGQIGILRGVIAAPGRGFEEKKRLGSIAGMWAKLGGNEKRWDRRWGGQHGLVSVINAEQECEWTLRRKKIKG